MKNAHLITILLVLGLWVPISSVHGGEYVREMGQNSLIYDPNPAPGEVAYWSGRVDSSGYATGFGVLTWFESGIKVSAYEGKKVRGKWKTIKELDIGSVSNSGAGYGQGNNARTQNREVRTGTSAQPARAIPTFLTRRYPFVDTASAIVTSLDSPRNITEWGFQDLIAPAGTSVVKVKLFRSQVILENQQRLYGGNFYMNGDVRNESRFQEEFRADAERGGSPMIIVTAYLGASGTRIESLPVTIEYYGGYREGSVSGSASAFRLSDEVISAIRRGEAYALDPYDVRSVFSYSGMVSESGFNGIGYFTPLFLTNGESGWTRGKGYFGRFQFGEFVETMSLDSFGGPLALEAQREAEARGAVIGNLAGVTLLGGMAVIAGGAIKLGGNAWESVQKSAASSLSNGGSGSTSAGGETGSTDLDRFKANWRGKTANFVVTWDNGGTALNGTTLEVQDPNTGKKFLVQYNLGLDKGLFGDGESGVGSTVSIRFGDDGLPYSIKNSSTGRSTQTGGWKVAGYGW
jgi:hypothetical protein